MIPPTTKLVEADPEFRRQWESERARILPIQEQVTAIETERVPVAQERVRLTAILTRLGELAG